MPSADFRQLKSKDLLDRWILDLQTQAPGCICMFATASGKKERVKDLELSEGFEQCKAHSPLNGGGPSLAGDERKQALGPQCRLLGVLKPLGSNALAGLEPSSLAVYSFNSGSS